MRKATHPRRSAWALLLAWPLAGGTSGVLADAFPAATWSPSPVPAFLRAFGRGDMAIARSDFGDAPALPSVGRLPSTPGDLTGLAVPAPAIGRVLNMPHRGAFAADVSGTSIDATSALPRPGTLSNAPVALPSYFLKDKIVAPHTSPDVEFGLNERTSLGLFGEVTQTNREDVRNNTVREGRDVGAGLTLQYKFDSR